MTAESSPFFILRGHEAQITSLAFNKENSQLYSGDVDGDVVVWDLRSRRPLRHMHVHTGGVLCVASLGVDYLFTHGRDRRACIWRLIDEITAKEAIATGRRTAPPQLIRQVAVNDTNFCKASLLCLAPSSTADTTLPLCIMAAPAVSHHDKIDVYCLKTEQKLCTIGEIEAKTGVCMALSLLNKQQQAFTSDASASSLLQYSYLLAGYEDGSVIAWMWSDTAESTISQMAWRVSVYKEPIMALCVNPVSHVVYVGSAEDRIGCIQYSLDQALFDGKPAVSYTRIKNINGVSDVVCRAELETVAFAGWNGIIYLFNNGNTKQPSTPLIYHRGSVSALAMTTCRSTLPSSEDGFSTSSVQIKPRSQLLQRSITRQQVDQTMLASGGRDGRIALWPLNKDYC